MNNQKKYINLPNYFAPKNIGKYDNDTTTTTYKLNLRIL